MKQDGGPYDVFVNNRIEITRRSSLRTQCDFHCFYVVCLNSSNVPTIPPPDPLEFEHAAVAADHKECSKVGRNILKKGGHAVDAAIATALCVGVVNPHSAGLGGGGFMIIYDRKSSKYHTMLHAIALSNLFLYPFRDAAKSTVVSIVLSSARAPSFFT